MRVLFINQYFPPDRTNTAVLLAQLCEDLARKGHEVGVVAGRASYNPSEDLPTPSGVRIVRTRSFGFSRLTMTGRLANYVSYSVGALWRALRDPHPDVVVTHSDPPFIGLVGAFAGAWHRCPFVQVYYDVYPDAALAIGKADGVVMVRSWRGLNRVVRRRASRIVAIGRDMRERLARDGVAEGKIAVLPNWAEPNDTPPETVARVRRGLSWADRFVVMHAGNVGLGHDLPTFLRAASRLRDEPDVLLVIMGDGAAKPTLERQAERSGLSNVQFLPYQERSRALEIIASADCHLISLAPGLTGCMVPSKVYGIMAAGRPVVAAVDADSEVGRLIAEVGFGLRVDPGDASGVAEAIRAIRDLDLERMGAAGRAAFESNYTRAVATNRYERLLESETASRS
jgi:colanic acid biosynthesis glycosyl transferase WcaI